MEEYYFIYEIDSLYVLLKVLIYILLYFLLYKSITKNSNRGREIVILIFLIFASVLFINTKLLPLQKDFLSERGMDLKHSEQKTYVNLIRARVVNTLEK